MLKNSTLEYTPTWVQLQVWLLLSNKVVSESKVLCLAQVGMSIDLKASLSEARGFLGKPTLKDITT